MRKYIDDHWRGAHSLPRSYWLNNILLGAIIGMLAGAVTAAGYALIATLFAIAVVVWGMVGTWRSASRSKREGLHGAWPVVVHVLIVFGIVMSIGSIYAQNDPSADRETNESIVSAPTEEGQALSPN